MDKSGGMVVKKYTTTNQLREILKTINYNIIQEIIIKECSNHIPFKLGWVEVQVGSNIYVVSFWDQDERYVQDAISYFKQMISEFNHLNIRRIDDK